MVGEHSSRNCQSWDRDPKTSLNCHIATPLPLLRSPQPQPFQIAVISLKRSWRFPFHSGLAVSAFFRSLPLDSPFSSKISTAFFRLSSFFSWRKSLTSAINSFGIRTLSSTSFELPLVAITPSFFAHRQIWLLPFAAFGDIWDECAIGELGKSRPIVTIFSHMPYEPLFP